MNDATTPEAGSRELVVAAVSTPVVLGDVEANLATIAEGVDAALAAGARLVVLPELATSGYVFADRAEAEAAALDAADGRLGAIARKAVDGAVVVMGFCERGDDGLFTSAAVLFEGAVRAVYRKSHLWGQECEIFDRGAEAGAIVDTPVGRVGIAICYDNEFPEVPRRLALGGAEVLALPVNWPLVPKPETEHAPEIIQAMASARSSRLPMVIADRHGEERGVPWTEGTVVIDGDGWIAASGTRGAVVTKLTLLGDKRLGRYNDLFGDRRPDLY